MERRTHLPRHLGRFHSEEQLGDISRVSGASGLTRHVVLSASINATGTVDVDPSILTCGHPSVVVSPRRALLDYRSWRARGSVTA